MEANESTHADEIILDGALHFAASIHQLARPDPFDLRQMQCFLSSDEMALPLIGKDKNTWRSWSRRDSFTKDGLVAVCPRQALDLFSGFLAEKSIGVLSFFHNLVADKVEGVSLKTGGFNDRQIERFTSLVVGVIAAGLPVLVMLGLMRAQSLETALMVIAGNNVVVLVCLTLLTIVGRKDVFLILALFTLIQIFFLGKRWV